MLDRIGAVVLFGLAANTDNISVGLAFGLNRRQIAWPSNLLIATITTSITLVALIGGLAIHDVLPPMLPDLLGGGLLLVLAAWNVYAERRGIGGSSFCVLRRFVRRPRIGVVETLFLAIALSINNIGSAIAGGVGGLDYRLVALSVGGFSIATLAVGQSAGRNIVGIKLPSVVRSCLNGNAVLALAGLFMLVGI